MFSDSASYLLFKAGVENQNINLMQRLEHLSLLTGDLLRCRRLVTTMRALPSAELRGRQTLT